MYTSNEITHTMCTSEILPEIFFCITCTTVVHDKYLSISFSDNYTGDIISHVHIENSLWNLMNSTRTQNLDCVCCVFDLCQISHIPLLHTEFSF